MKVKISTLLLIIIIIVVTIMGINFLLQPKKIVEIVKERNLNETTNEEIKTELEGKIDLDLQAQEKEFEEKIENYIAEIYYNEYPYTDIPTFENIESVSKWMFDCAMNSENVGKYFTKELIRDTQIQLFGVSSDNETLENYISEYDIFDRSTQLEEYLLYDQDEFNDKIINSNDTVYSRMWNFGPDAPDFENNYILNSMKKNNNIIIVNMIEYKSNQIVYGPPTELNLYKINSDEIVKSYSLENNTTDTYDDFITSVLKESIEFVKNNPELFSTATITLEYDEQNDLLYIKSFER